MRDARGRNTSGVRSSDVRALPCFRGRLAWGLVLVMACASARPATNRQENSSGRQAAGTPEAGSAIAPVSSLHPPAKGVDRSEAEGARQAAAATNQFAFALYQKVRAGDGNLVLSPLSATVALAMTAAGARGPTYDEMARVLRLSDLSDVDGAYQRMLSSLGRRSEDGATLRLAQRVWGQQGAHFAADFRARLADRYGAPLGVLDFARPEQARMAINEWAARETNDRVRELLRPGDVTPAARLILTNAVYFASRWRSRFDEHATRKAPFMTAQGTVSATMMHQLGKFAYARLPTASILELPCLGEFSMMILLPDSLEGLATLEMQLGEHYATGHSRLAERPVDLYLPRWKTTSTIPLDSALKEMGLSLAFGPSADFSAMAPNEPFHIGLVLQQASVEANEQGAEAAAGTAVLMYGYAQTATPPPTAFRADHPFVYLIRDRTTGVILFAGRVSDPS